MTIRGSMILDVAGKPVTITGGPFDSIPEGAYGVCLEVASARAGQADVLLPTADFGLPKPEELRAAVAKVLAQMEANPGQPVHVGCKGGVGRTGLFIAALAKAAGVEGDALDHVRRNYLANAAETPAQEAMARGFTWP